MNFMSLVDVFRRRRIAILLLVLLGMLLGGLAWKTTPTRFNASTVVVVLPAPRPDEPKGANPLTRLTYDAAEMSNLAVTLAQAPEVTQSLTRSHATLVSVGNDVDPNAPNAGRTARVTLVVEGETPEAADAAATRVVGLTQSRLQSFQKELGVPAAEQVRIQTLIPPHTAPSDRTDRLRATGASFLGTVVTGSALILAWELLRTRRRREPSGALRRSGTF